MASNAVFPKISFSHSGVEIPHLYKGDNSPDALDALWAVVKKFFKELFCIPIHDTNLKGRNVTSIHSDDMGDTRAEKEVGRKALSMIGPSEFDLSSTDETLESGGENSNSNARNVDPTAILDSPIIVRDQRSLSMILSADDESPILVEAPPSAFCHATSIIPPPAPVMNMAKSDTFQDPKLVKFVRELNNLLDSCQRKKHNPKLKHFYTDSEDTLVNKYHFPRQQAQEFIELRNKYPHESPINIIFRFLVKYNDCLPDV